MGDIRSESLPDLVDRPGSILHHVVQQCRYDHRFVGADVGGDGGHENRMDDIGFTAFSRLSGMGLFGEGQSLFDRVARLDRIEKEIFRLFDRHHRTDNVDYGLEGRMHQTPLALFHALYLDDAVCDLRNGDIGKLVFFRIHLHQRLGTGRQFVGTFGDGCRKQITVEVGFFEGFRRYFLESHIFFS